MSKLKPCPFCGKDNAHFSTEQIDSFMLGRLVDLVYVTCRECGCKTGYGIDREEAAEKWNRRVGND